MLVKRWRDSYFNLVVKSNDIAVTGETDFLVQTPDFAGPMDLLVHLVRRRELDVAYISVSAITADYLAWLDRNILTELDSAGDYILLAAILIQFKVFNLLPSEEPEFSEVEFIAAERYGTPEELNALRSAIARLAELESRQINLFKRGVVNIKGLEDELAKDMLAEVSAYDLALAFRDLIYNLPTEPTHIIEEIPYSIEGQTAFILSYFQNAKRIPFNRLAEALTSRLAVIMTFLAMLEMIRLRTIRVVQGEPFGPLFLILRLKSRDYAQA